jgi:hypothetical protein
MGAARPRTLEKQGRMAMGFNRVLPKIPRQGQAAPYSISRVCLAEHRLAPTYYFEVMGTVAEPFSVTRSLAGGGGQNLQTNVNFLHQIF